MFKCEVYFDTDKAKEKGYTKEMLYKTLDNIMKYEKLEKIKDGVYVDEKATTNKHTVRITWLLAHCPEVVHFCNYLDITDPVEGSEGNIASSLLKYRQYVALK